MQKKLLLLIFSIFLLSGCFEKKKLTDVETESGNLEITNFTEGTTSENGTSSGTSTGSSSASDVVIVSSTLVSIEKTITINFTESINAETVDNSSIYINDINQQPIAVTFTVINNQVNIIPNEFFEPGSRYTLVVTTGVKDILGRSLAGTFQYTFPTVPLTTEFPTLLSLSPANGSQAPNTTSVSMTFSEDIAGSAVIILRDSDTNAVVEGSTNIVGNSLRFVPNNTLTYRANYTATVRGGVEDLEGNTYSGLTTWNFSISPENDVSAPLLEQLTPEHTTEASTSTYVVMTFNEVIAGDGVLVVKNSGTNELISGTTAKFDNVLRFIPQSNLTDGTDYTVTLEGDITDLSGNNYTGLNSWNFFTTPLTISLVPPTLVALTPEANAIDVDKSTDVTMTFDENILDDNITLELRDSTSTLVAGVSSVNTNTFNFNPTNDLVDGEMYSVNIVGMIKDLNGNVYVGQNGWIFTVAPYVDNIAPTLITLTPLDSAVDVDKAADISIIFDEAISNVDMAFDVRDSSNNPVSGATTVSGNTITFNPTADLLSSEAYTVDVSGSVEDLSGNAFSTPTSWSFSVADTIAPSLVTLTPLDSAVDVDKAADISIIFDEAISNVDMAFDVRDSSNNPVSGATTVSGNTITFNPTADLLSSEAYTVDVSGSVEDLSGNAFSTPTSWSFSVADTIAPSLVTLTPLDSAVDVDKTTDISATFDENVTSTGSNFLVFNDTTLGAVSGMEGISGDTLWFTPDNDLIEGHQYTVTLLGPIYDDSNNTYVGVTSWSFTISPPVDSTPPTLSSLTPYEGEVDVNKSINMTMTFDENISDNGVLLLLHDINNTLVTGTSVVSANTFNFQPVNDLKEGMTYTVSVQGSIEDNAGNPYTGLTSWSFTVADTSAPSLVSLVPSDTSLNVDKSSVISIRLDENLSSNGATLQVFEVATSTPVSGVNSINGDTLTFIPDSNLNDDEEYNVTIQGTLEDLSGNAYSGQSNWSFTVLPAVDNIPPGLVSFTPADGATNADKGTEIYVLFDENVTNGGKKFTVRDETDDNEIFGSEGITGNKIWFIPDDNLIPGHTYSAEIHGPATEDLEGNQYTGQKKWFFSVKPFEIISAWAWGKYVSITFSYSVDESTLSENDFEINSGNIDFDNLNYSSLWKTVTFWADKDIDNGDVLTVFGTIEDKDGNEVYDGTTTFWTL